MTAPTVLAPFETAGPHDLLAALSAHMEGARYEVNHGGPLILEGKAWITPEERTPSDREMRRGLYDVAEEAIAAIEALGWSHAKPPQITIMVMGQVTLFELRPPRVGVHVALTLHLPHDTSPEGAQ